MRIYYTDVRPLLKNEIWQEKLEWMSEERKNRITKMKIEMDQIRSAAAGILLHVMAQTFRFPPEYEWCEGVNGKPYIKGKEDFFFNLSHSGNYAVLACDHSEIGIDIQERRVTSEAMVSRFLTQEEISELPENIEERINQVNRLWCIKESYSKLLGGGLLYSMKQCRVDLLSHRIIGEKKENEQFFFQEYKIEEPYHMAVCSRNDQFPEELIYYAIES